MRLQRISQGEEPQTSSCEGDDPRLLPAETSTASLPAAQQFEFWCDRNRPVVEFGRPEGSAAGFEVANRVWQLGGCVLSRVVAPALHTERSARAVRRAPVDHWVLGLSRRGTTLMETRRATCVAGPDVPFVYSLGEAFVSRRTDIDWLILFLSRDSFPEVASALDLTCGSTLDTPMGRLLADYLLLLERRLPEIGQSALPELRNATQAMIAACVAPTADRLAVASGAVNGTRLERVRRYVRTHLTDPDITPATLAARIGMSRSALYRLLEQEGGVARFVQRQRLLAANVMLADPECTHTIQRIAEGVGIPDAATFSRAFRSQFGCAPRDVRWDAARDRSRHPQRAPAQPARTGEAGFWSLLRGAEQSTSLRQGVNARDVRPTHGRAPDRSMIWGSPPSDPVSQPREP